MPLKPLEGARRVWVTLALSLAVFMQVLDTTIANVAIPTIAGNLGASASQGTWVITSFAVANAIAIPITGWLAKRLGEVRLFLLSTTGFVITSWLCGIAPNLEALILFRVLQGALAGPMIPLSQSLLLASYPDEKKGMALALWSMTVIVAPIFGPILGGWISDNWHWSWIFFINVPIGLAAIAISWKELKGRETAITAQPIDKIGLALLVIGVGALQIMLDRGKELDWFSSGEIVALTLVAVIALAYLVVWEKHNPHPVVDLSLFRHRNFSVGVLCLSVGFMLYFGTVVLMPLLLQTQMGYTATQAGLAMAPIGILPVILSPIIGKNAQRLDLRWIVTASFLIFAACFYWRTTFNPQMDFAWVVWPQFIQGIAVAGFFMPLTMISLAGLRADQIASASSLSNFMRTLSGSIGTSLITTGWERREAVHHVTLSSQISVYDPNTSTALAQMHAAGLSQQQAAALIAQDITRQGFFISANEIFWLCSILFIGLTLLVWLARPPFKPAGGGAVVDAGH
ncbi:DHA2 family efflux MFS transporter permease subunit [Craterilacuibacter sinensis]|uniref:DHA2 family efflux MFS transporter permease subunit n=1 Tax=Craterilacuibacter sinensis TaxID=2686017 RepID=A0A845BSC5_9NEIS|nr:DHA2 family efflux MFS transporter permease subunit [Craterilacuibacter sinensis]MXR38300.1 DHA2 family efflux MFS transporter permease subunit [Craterilacuibacter sinensis]RQW22210.1 DHA2 family efflux MFS transporter permease subunit [Rhodobacteraceae bacterium CH30]